MLFNLQSFGVVEDREHREVLISSSAPLWAYGLYRLSEQANRSAQRSERFVSETEFQGAADLKTGESAADLIGGVSLGRELSALLRDPAAGFLDDDGLNADAPIIRIVTMIFNDAIVRQASDIHLEVYGQKTQIRFRIDGVLKDVAAPPRDIYAAIVSRIKIMANLDIAEKRLPQDGRITTRLEDQMVDVRVSTLPTGHGERVVMRLLRKEAGSADLTSLGMPPELLAEFRRLIAMPNGIVLVTGPTGSGKTTTLYGAIEAIRTSADNIMTVEDPIEYEMAGVAQTQVQPKIGLSFAAALRAILRQDPDILMIGEIRDLETAQIAVQAALTGHLVLATLHTNDAPSSITRLIDMGIEPFLLSSTINGVLAQRLVRKLCGVCRIVNQGRAASSAYRANPLGCIECKQAGYFGRTGVFELMTNSGELRSAIKQSADAIQLHAIALKAGMVPLAKDAQRWIDAGITSAEEVSRVLTFEEPGH
jgi:general secretion pathway protein E